MKAVGYIESLPINSEDSLQDIELPIPKPLERDLLVKISAIAVNPVDYKIRQRVKSNDGSYKVLGWDAVGEVMSTGSSAQLFKKGDIVFYAGDLNRQGSNAEYQLVDERIVGIKPKHLSDADAAALPLTSITSWELLFEHLKIEKQIPSQLQKTRDVILIIGAAGGVGSILVQLASKLTGATVIASASRESSREWVRKLGAHHVISHKKPLKPQIDALGFSYITHVSSLNATDTYYEDYIDLLSPFGKIAMIDDPAGFNSLDAMRLKPKSLSLHIEFMFARSMYQAHDMEEQHRILNEISSLIDNGQLQTTTGQHLGVINAKNLKKAHEYLESGNAIGKLVLEGF